MSDGLLVQLDADGVLARRLDALEALLRNPAELLGAIGARLESRIQGRFESKTDPDGNTWAPISAMTVELYALFNDGASLPGTLLDRTRRMRDSLASQVSGVELEIGFAVHYARYHVTGTKRKDGSVLMPRRDPLFSDPATGKLGAGDEADVLAEVEAFLARALG